MTQLSKVCITYLLSLISISAFSQNLFDEPNVLKFANFLYATRQYQFASEEFERLVNLVPENNDYKINLIKSYRLAENYDRAEKRMIDFGGDSLTFLKGSLATEYLKIKLFQNKYADAQNYLKINDRLDTNTKLKYQEFIFLLTNNWTKADSINKNYHPLNSRYDPLLSDASKITYKSPFLAGTLSTFVPGLGKAYSGYWKDGAISLLFVSINAWESYRGFSKYGTHNASGWIFGTLGAGFYLGNIYGSIKAAIKHNQTANEKILHRAKDLIYSDIQ